MSTADASPAHPHPEVRRAIADWLLEVSALLAVFPWLDQLVFHAKGTFNWAVTATTFSVALGLAQSGLLFLCPPGPWRRRLVASTTVSFLTGLVIFWSA